MLLTHLLSWSMQVAVLVLGGAFVAGYEAVKMIDRGAGHGSANAPAAG